MPTAHLIIRLLREWIALSALRRFRITFPGQLPPGSQWHRAFGAECSSKSMPVSPSNWRWRQSQVAAVTAARQFAIRW